MVFHNHTTLDAPETVYYIRKKFKQWESMGIPCKIYYPEQSFWSLCLKKKMLPLRIVRFCCSELKEKEICLTICFFVLAFTYGDNEAEEKGDVDEALDEENAEADDYYALEEEGETGEEVEEADNYYGTESNQEEEDENILKSDEKENN